MASGWNITRPMTNPYFRLINSAGMIWDVTNGESSAATAWADSDTALTWDSTIGAYPVTIPAGLPAGEWDFLLYDAAVPADTDEVVLGYHFRRTIAGGLGELAGYMEAM